jgi:hypothetical protein
MWLASILALGRSAPRRSRRPRAPAKKARSLRLNLEQFEDRTLLSSYTAATVSDLINDINAANAASGTNTITLTAPTTSPYVLTAVDNTTDGANGLPVIMKGNTLTIIGDGDTIERSTASGTPAFRLLDLASRGSLTLENLTLQNGLALGSGSAADGGAIYNQGTLVLSAVTVQNNVAQGSGDKKSTGPAAGGGIWSGSSLTLENGTLLQNNQAMGAPGFPGGQFQPPIQGGDASGGGLYLSGGTANLTGASIDNDLALAGVGANAYGGGLYLAAGTLNLSSATVDSNQTTARDTLPAFENACNGGGLYVAGGTANLSGDTLDGNTASEFLGGNQTSKITFGGAIYVAARGTVTLCNDTVENNYASGQGFGGGLYIAPEATVYMDPFTVANTINNRDSSGLNGSTANIDGSYILQSC